VKVRLHRAREKLKLILEEECSFERDERNVLICTPLADRETVGLEGQSNRKTSCKKGTYT